MQHQHNTYMGLNYLCSMSEDNWTVINKYPNYCTYIFSGAWLIESFVLHRQKNMPQIHHTIITNGHHSIKYIMKKLIYNDKEGEKLLIKVAATIWADTIGTPVWFQCDDFMSTILQRVTSNWSKQRETGRSMIIFRFNIVRFGVVTFQGIFTKIFNEQCPENAFI